MRIKKMLMKRKKTMTKRRLRNLLKTPRTQMRLLLSMMIRKLWLSRRITTKRPLIPIIITRMRTQKKIQIEDYGSPMTNPNKNNKLKKIKSR